MLFQEIKEYELVIEKDVYLSISVAYIFHIISEKMGMLCEIQAYPNTLPADRKFIYEGIYFANYIVKRNPQPSPEIYLNLVGVARVFCAIASRRHRRRAAGQLRLRIFGQGFQIEEQDGSRGARPAAADRRAGGVGGG